MNQMYAEGGSDAPDSARATAEKSRCRIDGFGTQDGREPLATFMAFVYTCMSTSTFLVLLSGGANHRSGQHTDATA